MHLGTLMDPATPRQSLDFLHAHALSRPLPIDTKGGIEGPRNQIAIGLYAVTYEQITVSE